MSALERFFQTAADWADRNDMDIKFTRDTEDGWFAIVEFSDTKGIFWATVDAFSPKPARRGQKNGEDTRIPPESEAEYYDRLATTFSKACTAARKRRTERLSKVVLGSLLAA